MYVYNSSQTFANLRTKLTSVNSITTPRVKHNERVKNRKTKPHVRAAAHAATKHRSVLTRGIDGGRWVGEGGRGGGKGIDACDFFKIFYRSPVYIRPATRGSARANRTRDKVGRTTAKAVLSHVVQTHYTACTARVCYSSRPAT